MHRISDPAAGREGRSAGRNALAVPASHDPFGGSNQVGYGDEHQVGGPPGVVGDADEGEQSGERQQGRDLQSRGPGPGAEQTG